MYVDTFHGILLRWHKLDISMGPEAILDLIRVFERQIKEGDGDIIKLKRDRNSLLNISTRNPRTHSPGTSFGWDVSKGYKWALTAPS